MGEHTKCHICFENDISVVSKVPKCHDIKYSNAVVCFSRKIKICQMHVVALIIYYNSCGMFHTVGV